MLEIDLSPLDINEEVLEDRLQGFFNRKFRWQAYGGWSTNFRIYGPEYVIEDTEIFDFFKTVKPIDLGNQEHMKMIKYLELLRLLETARSKNEPAFLDSIYFSRD